MASATGTQQERMVHANKTWVEQRQQTNSDAWASSKAVLCECKFAPQPSPGGTLLAKRGVGSVCVFLIVVFVDMHRVAMGRC